MSVEMFCPLSVFDLHLLGGGHDALALAKRIGRARLTVHGESFSGALRELAEQSDWYLDTGIPVASKGQCWLIATGDSSHDERLVVLAEQAGIAIFVPRLPARSNVRLTNDVTARPDRQSAAQGLAKGHVSLVGAGPGDPELLTLKALDRLKNAEVVIHDRLVSDEVLALVSPDAKRFYVGKARSSHSVPQEGINQALVDWAKAGYRVVRLKGGDPFVFGRGGEELEQLAAEGIDFEVVPGITAALGISAYSGIPLTHRDYAQSVRFVTGHLKNGSVDLDWPTLAAAGQTLVFYMGLGSLGEIACQLMAHGASPQTPIALIEQGTTARQRVHVGTLETIESSVANLAIAPPTLIIVGGVVGLYRELKWFDEGRAHSLGWQHGKHPTPLQRAEEL